MKVIRRIKKSNLLKALLIVLIVVAFKLIFQYIGLEFLEINTLLTAIISGNIFILGFLLNSTLRDFKEAERFPGDFSSTLETIYDDCEILYKSTKNKIFLECIEHILYLNDLIYKWFNKKAYTQEVLFQISEFNKFWSEFESLTQANFIVRLKNEQNNLRKMLIRVNTLRDTPFYEASYKIAKLSVIFLLIILTLLTSDPFYENLFFISVIVFINVFLVNLIRDLDDPFEYDDLNKSDEVSLKPFLDLEARIKKRGLKFAKSL